LHGGDSMIQLEGNAITFETSGLLSVKGAGHPLVGPGGQAAELPPLPLGVVNLHNKLELNLTDDNLKPVPNAPYKVRFSDGTTISGKLDSNGHAVLHDVPGPGKVFFGEDPRPFTPAPLPAAKAVDPEDVLKELHDAGHQGISDENLASLFNQFSGRPDVQ